MTPDPASASALERLLRDGSDADVGRFFLLLTPPEIADLLETLRNDEDRARAFRAIVSKDQPRVLRGLEEGERAGLVEELAPERAADLLEALRTDDAADVLQELDESTKADVLQHIEPEERRAIECVMDYPPQSAGGIMQTELVRVNDFQTTRAAVEEIRRTRDKVGELHEVFVVDRNSRLKGWIKARDLILAEDDTLVASITTPVPVTVPVTEDQEEIASLVQDYDASSVAVVDHDDRLVGRILIDDIVDVLEEEATEDIVRLGGTAPGEIYEPSVGMALRARSPWLGITFLGGIAAALIMDAGDDLIKHAGALFAFVPVILGMGGASATQTATVTVRSLALGRISPGQLGAVIGKELLVGFVLAIAVGSLLFLVTRVVDADTTVAWIASLAMFGTVSFGTLFGVITPLVLDKFGVDPAVATSPFVTTVNDLLGSALILGLCWFAAT